VEVDLIEKYVKKSGMSRVKLTNAKISSPHNVFVYFFLGELQTIIHISQLFLSSSIDKNRYNVVITWDGLEGLFTGVDEVLTVGKQLSCNVLYNGAEGCDNKSAGAVLLLRLANEYFLNVFKASDLKIPYTNNFTDAILEKNFNYFSPSFLRNTDREYNFKINKKTVVIFPFQHYKKILYNREVPVLISDSFYREAIRKLSALGFKVICIQNDWCFNISDRPIQADVEFIKESRFDRIVMLMRKYGCVFDFFGDLTVLSYLAQVACFSVAERTYFMKQRKDLEKYIFDFIGRNHIIFSFFESFYDGGSLNIGQIDNIIDRFVEFYNNMIFNFTNQIIEHKEVDFGPYLKYSVAKKHAKIISKCILEKRKN
jgi:hypothetical protein